MKRLGRQAAKAIDRAVEAALFFVFVLKCQALLGRCWAPERRCQAPGPLIRSYSRQPVSLSEGGIPHA